MGELEELQAWYLAQCDGDWEHQYGVKIDTLDNPGWRVSIDLVETRLEATTFEDVVDKYEHDMEWMRCWRDHSKFEIACGPSRLADGLRVFLDWAASLPSPSQVR